MIAAQPSIQTRFRIPFGLRGRDSLVVVSFHDSGQPISQPVSSENHLPIIQDVGTEHYLKGREVTKPRMKYLGISVAG